MELAVQQVISGSQMSGDEPGVHSEDGQPLLHKLSLILCSYSLSKMTNYLLS